MRRLSQLSIHAYKLLCPVFSFLLVYYADLAQAQTCEATGGAHCYYVSVNGNDANAGTFNSPYRSFRPAILRAAPGDYIYARGGTYDYDNAMLGSESRYIFMSIENVSGQYTVNNGSAGNPITVRNYPGETPILDLNDSRFNAGVANRMAISIREKSFWTIDGFEILNGFIGLNHYPNGATVNGGLTHDIIIKNNNVHHLTMESGENHGLIFINRGDNGGAHNISILNNQLHDFFDSAHPGQWMNTGVGGIHLAALTTLSCQTYVGYDCGYTGSITFSGNTVYHVPQAFFFKNPSPGPVTISDNIFHDIESIGTMITSNVTMNHNLVYNTEMGWAYVGRDGLQSTPNDFYAISGQNAVITDNTFIGLNQLFGIVNGTHHIVRNNVFFGMEARTPGAGYDTTAYIKKSSTYPDPASPAQSILQDITSNNNCFITPYTDFQMVQRHVGAIEHYTRQQANTTFGFDPNSIFISPANTSIFIDPASNNYNFKDTSPPHPCQGMGYYSGPGGSPGGDRTPPAAPQGLQVN